MATAIVHEWIESSGGSENVAEAIADLYPGADIFCLWNDAPNRFPGHVVYESWIAKTPLRQHKALALPLMPFVWRALGAQQHYDKVVVSSHLFAHHARLPGLGSNARKYVYVHTPARYIWSPELDHRGRSLLVRSVSPALKRIDALRAAEAESIAANSEYVRKRIQDSWNLDARVIHPPVNAERISAVEDWGLQLGTGDQEILSGLPKVFLLGASRFVPYKGLDKVIHAGAASGLPVVLAGGGPDETRLRSLAAESFTPVFFVLKPSNNLLYALYQRALALVFPAIEDFGIVPVEAMAAGTPVIGNAVGGVGETVVDGITGALLQNFDRDSLRLAVDDVSRLEAGHCVTRALQFGRDRFATEIASWVG